MQELCNTKLYVRRNVDRVLYEVICPYDGRVERNNMINELIDDGKGDEENERMKKLI